MSLSRASFRTTTIWSALVLSALLPPSTAQDTTVAPPPESQKTPAPIPHNPKLPTLWVASDSTAADGGPNATGWGVSLPGYFDPKKINVVNRARGGRSSRTFITEGLWGKLLEGVKPGDFVLIQFGHNDAGTINDDSRARGSIRSLGDETQEIDNLLTKKHEVVHTFGWYMRKMIADTKSRGATPIILSLTVRDEWKDGKVERLNGPWSGFAAEVAQREHVAFIDLTRLIADEYERRGEEAVKKLFPKDHTHTSPQGGNLNATLVVAGLRALPSAPFDDDLSSEGRTIAPARNGVAGVSPP